MPVSLRRVLAVSVLLLVFGSPIVLANEADDRAALEVVAQAWIKAFNARDADALVALATPDVVLLDENMAPVSGQRAVRAAWAQALSVAQGEVTSATKEIAISGDVAWRIGAMARQLPHGGGLSRGRSLEIWKRVNGDWKLHRQMASGVLAQSSLRPRPLPSEPVFDKPSH
jgi:ketosteroid isomerase-like protein